MKNAIAVFTAVIIFTFFFSFSSIAQISVGVKRYSKDTRLGIGLSAGKPTTYMFNSAIDADIRWQKDVSSYVSVIANVGFTYFLRNGNTVDGGLGENIGFLPVKAGAKVFPMDRVYLSGEAGMAFGITANQPSSMVYAPGIGFEFHNGLDLGLRYESYTKYEIAKIAVKIAYGFSLHRQTGYSF